MEWVVQLWLTCLSGLRCLSLCTLRAPHRCCWGTRSSTVCPHGAVQALSGRLVICNIPSAPCGHSQGAWPSITCPHGVVWALLGHPFICSPPSQLHVCTLRVLVYLRCTLMAPYGRSHSTYSSAVCPHGALPKVSPLRLPLSSCQLLSPSHWTLVLGSHCSPTPVCTGAQTSFWLPSSLLGHQLRPCFCYVTTEQQQHR